jgi:hypothetical protein|mmetsp:Transcript_8966/g.25819  ORF Transcript_8966/g.25819 Transcript_8966/m.25819 type:complete len:87 (-) Transcript_8966:8378-8638(-)
MPGGQRISLMMAATAVSPTHQVQIPGVSFISQICVVWMQQFTPEVVNTHLQQLITHAGTDWQFHQRYEPSNIQGKRGVLMFQNIIL